MAISLIIEYETTHLRDFRSKLIKKKKVRKVYYCFEDPDIRTYKKAKIVGHNSFDNTTKTCPNFDVDIWCKDKNL